MLETLADHLGARLLKEQCTQKNKNVIIPKQCYFTSYMKHKDRMYEKQNDEFNCQTQKLKCY